MGVIQIFYGCPGNILIVLGIFDGCPGDIFMGVLEILYGCHGDIYRVSWRYLMGFIEIFDLFP